MNTITCGTPAVPPHWALLERRLLEAMSRAAVDFVHHYTREDGTLVWRDEWPGMDGSDDGYESFGNFPLFYALGGDEELHRLARFEWDAVTRQFTAYGQVHREFDAYYDWMHHGESSLYIYYFGLADPTVAKDRDRTLRFAAMYMGDDDEADNWDAAHRMMRSPITGSRGPRYENSAIDWVTHRPILAHYPPPFEDIPGVPGPLCDWNDDRIFGEVLTRLNQRMMRGDVPLNLASTSLVTSAYCYTGDDRYRNWVLDYTSAWRERAEANGGVIPDNVGPNGIIGECMDGKWWGGYYGYRWPHGVMTVLEPVLIASANCLLLTGDKSWLDFARGQLDLLVERGERRDGRLCAPYRHGDNGWYDVRPLDPRFHLHLWYLSQDEADRQRMLDLAPPAGLGEVQARRGKAEQANTGAWLRFLVGDLPSYPELVLEANYQEGLRRMEVMRHDDGDVNEWDVHHWQEINPLGTEGLVQLTLGGPSCIYHGGLLHCRLRWFDPAGKRAGLPQDMAALVERLTPDGVTVRLHNLDPVNAREAVVQAGAFGEHRFDSVRVDDGEAQPVNDKRLAVTIAPGAEAKLELQMTRYANAPSYDQP